MCTSVVSPNTASKGETEKTMPRFSVVMHPHAIKVSSFQKKLRRNEKELRALLANVKIQETTMSHVSESDRLAGNIFEVGFDNQYPMRAHQNMLQFHKTIFYNFIDKSRYQPSQQIFNAFKHINILSRIDFFNPTQQFKPWKKINDFEVPSIPCVQDSRKLDCFPRIAKGFFFFFATNMCSL